MRVLLDTQCWLWMHLAPDRLTDRARDLLEDDETELLLSAASLWEVSVKHALRKLTLPDPPERYVPERCAASGIAYLSIDHRHALRVGTLPMHHRDPFDRLLVAQAQVERLPLMTSDPHFELYDLAIIRASSP